MLEQHVCTGSSLAPPHVTISANIWRGKTYWNIVSPTDEFYLINTEYLDQKKFFLMFQAVSCCFNNIIFIEISFYGHKGTKQITIVTLM